MKQYIIIALCILAGKYVDLPIWLNVLFGMSAFWAISQVENVGKS
ncbi:MAG: hypothetical protein PUI73_03560 [bacterium]|nr:hypothetical protein [bacterium]MDY5457101.1 hypothetical protein [Bariatricus sp.]